MITPSMNSLPVELLINLFSFTINGSSKNVAILERVCKLWRAILQDPRNANFLFRSVALNTWRGSLPRMESKDQVELAYNVAHGIVQVYGRLKREARGKSKERPDLCRRSFSEAAPPLALSTFGHFDASNKETIFSGHVFDQTKIYLYKDNQTCTLETSHKDTITTLIYSSSASGQMIISRSQDAIYCHSFNEEQLNKALQGQKLQCEEITLCQEDNKEKHLFLVGEEYLLTTGGQMGRWIDLKNRQMKILDMGDAVTSALVLPENLKMDSDGRLLTFLCRDPNTGIHTLKVWEIENTKLLFNHQWSPIYDSMKSPQQIYNQTLRTSFVQIHGYAVIVFSDLDNQLSICHPYAQQMVFSEAFSEPLESIQIKPDKIIAIPKSKEEELHYVFYDPELVPKVDKSRVRKQSIKQDTNNALSKK